MGARMSDLFAAAGYPYCEGGIMSGEAACCRSFSSWCRVFDGWISGLEPDDLLRSKIFFDFRGSLDDGRLVDRLRQHLKASLVLNPRFFPLLAGSVLHYVPPITSFGGFVLKTTDGVRDGFDVKGVLAQVVDVARLRALQYGVIESGTLERLEALADGGHLVSSL